MTDELIVRARQSCCRLCLAPDSECVPILTSLAADKEPLPTKIHACVNIKVNQADRLSSRICHSCISFLNSWQSFKNRCLAAQMKQMNWLEMAKNSMRRQIGQMHQHQAVNPANKYSQNRPLQSRPMPFPIIIKTEPIDEEADAQERAMKVDLDPIQFLVGRGVKKQEVSEEESLLRPSSFKNEEPQILTSLGLTHINSVNPYSHMNMSHDGNRDQRGDQTPPNSTLNSSTCRVCNVTLSSGPNARRHERNVHGKIFNELTINPEMPELYAKPAPRRISLLKTPLARMRLATPVTPEMMGIYEYETPKKYRHLLTDSKLAFIRRHEEFLLQYQTMTCTCCPKVFPTYKVFMAHMRKKYQNLSRNLCFKCLKQFQSKAMFVAHLKKKNCINLYKLYKADETIPKSGPLSLSPEKMGTKELLTNKVYECKLCTKTFRLKMEFRTHVYEDHPEKLKRDVAPGLCGFCNVEIEDPAIRRRHYNNMECIVMLHCGTCQEKFDNHQRFIEHVYQTHLTAPVNNNETPGESSDGRLDESGMSDSFNSRLPHSCNICGQRYNNYYNVLRHMETKHPDQVPKRYICEICNEGFPRQGPLREHMHEVHNTTLPRTRRDMIACRMCTDIFDARDKWIQHQTDLHSRYTCSVCNFQSKSLEEFSNHVEIHPQLSSKNAMVQEEVTILTVTTNGGNDGDDEQEAEETPPPAKKIKLDTSLKECPLCHATFNGNLRLSNHMRSHYAHDHPKVTSRVVTLKSSKMNSSLMMTKKLDPAAAAEMFRRVRCRLCQKRFTSKKTYRKHMLVDHQVRNVNFIKCGLCNAEFTHDKGLKVHLYKSHGTVMSSETVDIHFECEICLAVFKKELELNVHKFTEHSPERSPLKDETPEKPIQSNNGPAYWYQCRYCPSNFDTNKKLAIHINSHNEFDSNDYSCKDCGNVYNGRKSLWVHRYKKHPQIANPATCNLCKKLFFDKNMLFNHLKNHTEAEARVHMKNLKFELQDDQTTNLKVDGVGEGRGDEEEEEDILLDKVYCSVCNEEFTDQDLFDKHMEMHQVDLYSDNPLAAMFDTGPENPDEKFSLSDNGAYTCDICPKSFALLTALKVHRNWHFRTDGKQLQATSDLNVPRSLPNCKKNSKFVCEFCDSSFASSSNLRRHIAEVHKSETGDADRTKVFVDKYLECTKCVLKFETKAEWVNHKITHAKDSASSAFEWACEICGKVVSRKERLLHHMNSHLKVKQEGDDGNGSIVSEDQSNSQDSAMSSNAGRQSAVGKLTTGDDDEEDGDNNDEVENGDDDDDDDEDENEEEEENDEDDNDEPVTYHQENIEEAEEIIDDTHENGHDDDDDYDEDEHYDGADDEDNEHDNIIQYEEGDEDDSSQQYQEIDPDQDDVQDDVHDNDEMDNEDNSGSYSCDLCQVYFETSKQLRRHVTSHFLNGPGSVTLTEIPKEKSYSPKIELGEDVTTITPV